MSDIMERLREAIVVLDSPLLRRIESEINRLHYELREARGESVQTPIQPLERDKHGVARFRKNEIVAFLLENGGYDMNALARMDFSDEDREQFAQLIGYSVSGFGDLSYVSETALERAEEAAEKLPAS